MWNNLKMLFLVEILIGCKQQGFLTPLDLCAHMKMPWKDKNA